MRRRSAIARVATPDAGANRSNPWGAGVDMELHRDPGRRDPPGVVDVLVAKDVELPDLDVGGCNATEVDGPGWRRRGGDLRPAG
jgi:hypothetical protein